jgi:hypothetical protein
MTRGVPRLAWVDRRLEWAEREKMPKGIWESYFWGPVFRPVDENGCVIPNAREIELRRTLMARIRREQPSVEEQTSRPRTVPRDGDRSR